MDSDDIWHPEKIKRQMEKIYQVEATEFRPIFSFTGRFRVDGEYALLARQFTRRRVNSRALRQANCVGTLSSVIATQWLMQHVRGFDEELNACQDWDLYLR